MKQDVCSGSISVQGKFSLTRSSSVVDVSGTILLSIDRAGVLIHYDNDCDSA